jgi:hypothetical protein
MSRCQARGQVPGGHVCAGQTPAKRENGAAKAGNGTGDDASCNLAPLSVSAPQALADFGYGPRIQIP